MLSCHPEKRKQNPGEDAGKSVTTEELIEMNRQMVRQAVEANEAYARRHGWDFQREANGMIWELLTDHDGPHPESGDRVVLTYRIADLADSVLYAHTRSGKPLVFTVDYDAVEAGLNQMVRRMSRGDSARFILPPHLAYGLTGDGDRVLPATSLVYQIGLVDVQK